VLGVVLGEALERIQGTEPHGGLLVAKLLYGRGIELSDAPLPSVDLLQALAAVGEQQIGRPACAQGDRRARPYRVGLCRRLSLLICNLVGLLY
jgi:hypothetical protein